MLSFFIANAQHTVSGRVLDQLTHEALRGATVTDKLNTVATDANGYFEIRTSESFISITYSSYQTKDIKITNSNKIIVSLLPYSKDLEQVVISANRTAQKRNRGAYSDFNHQQTKRWKMQKPSASTNCSIR